MTIDIAAPQRALGPRRNAQLIAHALRDRDIAARLVERPARDSAANVHLANSSRELLWTLARRRGCLVTVHDVAARDPRVRPALAPVVRHVLRRHRVVVHSRHAAALLGEVGLGEQVGVVPLALPVVLPAASETASERKCLLADRTGPLLVLAGVLKEAKGVADVVRAVRGASDARLVLMGRVADAPTARAVSEAPPNVTVLEGADDATFARVLAAADALLLPRTDSVGETSGPLVMAHALGTPVAMLDTGSAPEYRLEGDLVLAEGTEVAELVARSAQHAWRPVDQSPDDQVNGAVDAYRKEFHALGWI